MLAHFLLALVATQELVEHSSPSFRLRVPSGYIRIETPPNLVYRFAKEPPRRTDPRLSILIEVYPMMIPEGELPGIREGIEEQVRTAFGTEAKVLIATKTVRWRDLDIRSMELRTSNKAGEFLSLQAFVPLYPKGIRVEVVGLNRYQSDIYSDFSELISHLEGIPSWISPAQDRLMRWIPMSAAASFFGAPVYVLAWLIFFRRKPRRLRVLRTLWMLGMGALALASPVFWKVFVYGQTPTPAPGVCTWPVALFLAAPWLMLGTARFAALFMNRRDPEVFSEPSTPA